MEKKENKIREILKKNGTKQRWLAHKSLISEALISIYATNKMQPRLDRQQRIAEALGHPISEVFPFTEN